MKQPKPRWRTVPYDIKDVRAIQALAVYATGPDGMQPPSQAEVKRALDWIINHAAGTYDEPFEAGAPDVTAYLLGRRSVGLNIVKLMKLKPEIIDG